MSNPGLTRRIGCAIPMVLAACARPAPPLEVRFAGCPAVEAGPTCVLRDEKPITIQMGFEPAGSVEARFEGEVVPLVITSTASRVWAELSLPGPGHLVVQSAKRRFELEVVAKSRADPSAIEQSREARAHLARGEWARAIELFESSALSHSARGAWSRAVEDSQAAAYTLIDEAHRLDEAARWLDRAEPWLVHHPEGWAFQPYYRGLLALASADPARALQELNTSRARLASFVPSKISIIEDVRAYALQILGRHDEARAIFAVLAQTQGGLPCDRARLLNNVAWSGLLAADAARAAPTPTVLAALEKARALFEGEKCEDWYGGDLVWLHLALAELLTGDGPRAREWLERAPEGEGMLSARLWRLELSGRIALKEGRAREAHAAFARGGALARETLTLDAAWRFEVLEAEACAGTGHATEELAALERAERLLSDVMLRVPLGEGRGAFLANHTRSAQMLARRAIAAGRPEDAACALRRMRARGLSRAARVLALRELPESARAEWTRALGEVQRGNAELEARAIEAWSLPVAQRASFVHAQASRVEAVRKTLRDALASVESVSTPLGCEELVPAGPGEVLLAYFELDGRVLGLASTPSGTRTHAFGAKPREPPEWLSPFAQELAASHRVRLLTGGPETGVALHTAAFQGAMLGARRAVSYSLDLAQRPARDMQSPRALVVSDAARNLEGARQEGEAAVRALKQNGWSVEHLDGVAATASAVRGALGTTSLLHVAGHARADRGSAWTDHLVLHQSTLEPLDILAAGAVPRWVVLTGCETSVLRPEEHGAGLSLAHAFLLAGAEQVLAATSAVDDAAAGALGAQLYEGDGALDLSEAYRRVLAETATAARTKWTPLRVWSR